MQHPAGQEATFSTRERPQCIPSFFELLAAIEKDARYYHWRASISRCLQYEDERQLKELMDDVVTNVVTTKLPFFHRNAGSFYGSPDVTRAALHLSKDLALIFDKPLQSMEITCLDSLLSLDGSSTILPVHTHNSDTCSESQVHAAKSTANWFQKLMTALTRVTISTPGYPDLFPRLGCSADGTSSMEDILVPLLKVLHISSSIHPPEVRGTRSPQHPLQSPAKESQSCALSRFPQSPIPHEPTEELGHPQAMALEHVPVKRSAVVCDKPEPVHKRMKCSARMEELPKECPIQDCPLEWKVRGRGSLIEHIEAHTLPYRCTISRNCNLKFSRISNLNRHRESQHGSITKRLPRLKTEDVIEVGEIHHRIRKFESLPQLKRLLEALGFSCCDV